MANRDPVTGKFLPGNSANPGGRPKGEVSITALIDEAVTGDDWRFIIKKMRDMARRGNLKVIEMLMDRRWGKPTQKNEINASLQTEEVMPLENYRAAIAKLAPRSVENCAAPGEDKSPDDGAAVG